jgi:adenine-specific DNA-methyltransferase
MENLLHNLKTLLQKDERLTSEGELLKNKIIELALKLDKDLIELLLSDKQMKEVFFTQVGKAMIFDKDKFIRFVSNKQFLPDSYTSFKNKIGLIDEKGEFVSEKKEVVISWPYKDCVLEGGMTKEDQKRDEIFWNEILAPDEISRLLDPKVFTNAKRIDKKGEHKFDKFRTDENGNIKDNLIIKGNNLLALHSLKKRFAGKVKLIYIDPPYNTGGAEDTFTYNNNFKHSTWLTFMKNRLEIAKNFLKEEGFIAVAIDHNELFYLGMLLDEIFGRENRLGIVSVAHKPGGVQFSKFFSTSNDFMIVYAKNHLRANFNSVCIDDDARRKFDKEDDKGLFREEKFMRDFDPDATKEKKPNYWYPIYVSENLKELSLVKKKGYTEVFPISSTGRKVTWNQKKETFLENYKNGEIYAKSENGRIQIVRKVREWQPIKTLWTDKRYDATSHGTKLLKKTLGEKPDFSYPKSLYTVLDVVKIMTSKDDIIMDFFAGSGTTGHAILGLNREDNGHRQFILVEQLDEHIMVAVKRIRKVLQNQGGGDFVYMELSKWNENFADEIKKAKSGKELQKLWEVMKEKAHLSYKVDIAAFDKAAKDFADLSLENQKRFLLECLDKNHLYVNYSEIDDEEYGVSDEDKKMNREFYRD